MHLVIRTYSGNGAKELVDVLTAHKADVEQRFRGIEGFHSYMLADTHDGCVTVTLCETRAALDESIVKAREWVIKNASQTGVGAPVVVEGAVVVHLK